MKNVRTIVTGLPNSMRRKMSLTVRNNTVREGCIVIQGQFEHRPFRIDLTPEQAEEMLLTLDVLLSDTRVEVKAPGPKVCRREWGSR